MVFPTTRDGETINTPKIQIEKTHPLETNGYNCGVHICLMAEEFVQSPEEAIIYDTSDMHKHRLYIHEKIINGRLIARAARLKTPAVSTMQNPRLERDKTK